MKSYTGDTHKALSEMSLDSLIMDFFEIVLHPTDGRDVASISVVIVNSVINSVFAR